MLHPDMNSDAQNPADLTEEELVVLSQKGDMRAFEGLVKREQSRVMSILFRLAPSWADTADLAQEVFIRMWTRLRELRNPAAFPAWLRQIVVNLLYDELRRKAKFKSQISIDQPGSRGTAPEEIKELAVKGQEPDEVCSSREIFHAVRKAMDELPEHYRTAVVLREFEGLSYDEIATLTGTTIGTVKSRISRARSKIQHAIAPVLEGSEFAPQTL